MKKIFNISYRNTYNFSTVKKSLLYLLWIINIFLFGTIKAVIQY